MKYQNVRQETIKILQEKTGSNFFDLGRNTLLDGLQRQGKQKMNYWDLIKIKSFCTVKETINKPKRQLREWEKIYLKMTI